MKITTSEFLGSFTEVKNCPEKQFPEYAFIGRSNVGKSSLINMLTNRKMLAKISSSPGKTKTINYFTINNQWFLVDLPGYGYAKLSKSERAGINKMISNYILKRENLSCLFILIDSRLEPQEIDIEFINNIGQLQIPISIVFTKADKISENQLINNKTSFEAELLKTWIELPVSFITSSKTGKGQEEILNYIEKTNKQLAKR